MKFELESEFPHAELPLFIINSGQMRVERPVVDASKCCWCGTCYLLCPTGCLIDKEAHFEANLDYCKGCGICASMCPVQAIAMIREEY